MNDTVAFDAGCLGFIAPLDVQERVRHIVLSHAHIDHVASLPIFLDNVYRAGPDCPSVYASQTVWDSLRTHIFNDVIWPDVIRLSQNETPFVRQEFLTDGRPVTVGGLSVLPIQMDHVVPTMGFVIEQGDCAIGIVCDTRPTTAIWDHLNQRDNLKAVFLEASFPNSMAWLADIAAHLTPSDFQAESKKLRHDVPLFAIHIKPAFRSRVVAELEALGMPNLHIGEADKTYEF